MVLGTASQVPTRHRNHNGYLLRWDGEGILLDPGEGTQRQMLRAGVAAHDLNRICVTHFHGDHSLGLAGVIQRINLDKVPHEVTAHYPKSGQHFFDRLRYSTAYRETVEITQAPVSEDGVLATAASYTLEARKLSHPVESYGYLVVEPDGRRMLPDRLAAHGIKGPDVGRIQREGSVGGVSSRTSARCGAGSGSRSSWTPGCATACTRWPRGATCSSSSRRSWTRTSTWRSTTAI